MQQIDGDRATFLGYGGFAGGAKVCKLHLGNSLRRQREPTAPSLLADRPLCLTQTFRHRAIVDCHEWPAQSVSMNVYHSPLGSAMTRNFPVLPCLFVVLLFRTVAADEPDKAEFDRFAGVWKVETLDVNGRRSADADLKNMRFEFNEKRVIRKQDGEVDRPMTFTIDPRKSPKQIDFVEDGVTGAAIYEFTPDSLKLCFRFNATQGARPANFDAGVNSMQILAVLKRLEPSSP
jgi:uncharacterized protein (TIGR03067 family)